jgi:hypothetical protein
VILFFIGISFKTSRAGGKTLKTKKSLLISQKRFRAVDLSFSGSSEQDLAPSSGIPEGLLRFRRAIPSTFLDKKINKELGANVIWFLK